MVGSIAGRNHRQLHGNCALHLELPQAIGSRTWQRLCSCGANGCSVLLDPLGAPR